MMGELFGDMDKISRIILGDLLPANNTASLKCSSACIAFISPSSRKTSSNWMTCWIRSPPNQKFLSCSHNHSHTG